MKKLLLFLILSCSFLNVFSQNTNLPKIMVIPFTKDGEDLRTILDNDINTRIAIAKVKEGFDSRGFTTIDFIGKLKSAKDNQVFTMDNQTDIKAKILELSGSDIYIVAETSTKSDETGSSATIIINGYETATGNSVANKVSNSGKFQTNDIEKLVSRAVEKSMDEFTFMVSDKFNQIIKNGRSVLVDFGFSENAVINMTTEIDKTGLALSDLLEDWISKNSFNGSYHIQGTTNQKMIFDEVKIPLKDKNSNNYTSTKFALDIFKYLKSLNLDVRKEIKGGTIYITIN
jgi:hypothetical protein